MLAILIFFMCSVKSSGRGVVRSISLALSALLCCFPFSHLRQRGFKVADVALWAHPALRTDDTLQIIADELEELVRLAGRASNPHPAMRSHYLSHPPDPSVWDANAITDLEWFTLYNVLNSRFTALRSTFSGSNLRPGSKRGNKSPIDSPFLERLFPPCCGSLKWRTPFHGGNRHGLPGYFVRLGHAM